MSIENTLERIAVALETLVSVEIQRRNDLAKTQGPAETGPAETGPATQAQQADAPKKKTNKKENPVAEPSVGLPMGEPEPTPVTDKPITKDELTKSLRLHASRYGVPITKGLMIKAGANPTEPTVDSIPVINYAALYTQITGDLSK